MMETLSAGSSLFKQGVGCRTVTSLKDLWTATRCGTVHDVDMALVHLKRINGNIDARNTFGSTALHIAVWRNHVPVVRRLLAAGSDPDARDGESGWSSLHRALHFGHLAVAGVLIEAGASLLLEDSKSRTPVDLLSGTLKQVLADANNLGASEVFSWGNGANYQLGTGTAGIQKLPCRIDALQGLHVTAVAAAKFHSVAVTEKGDLYSWGFGRGGRLGHPDFDIHSGQAAVITPQLVTSGLGSRRVKAVAVAKHHTVVATDGGEVFTWGSNREGQLGYPSVDTQPIPRRVSSVKTRVNAVAAANKHTAVLTEAGEVYTWGYNGEGQLGYGTSNSASNYTPRVVDYLKGKVFVAVSAAKYHTVVLGAEGEVFTWGYKMVMPRRVMVARDIKKGGMVPLKFHRAERLHVVAIAAGTTHSTVLSEDGLVFCWISADPHLRCYQLLSMARHQAVAVAAGKYRTAVVTAFGDLYGWDGEKTKGDALPTPFCVHGVKHATHISVAENHSLVIAAVYVPKFPPNLTSETYSGDDASPKDLEDSEEDLDMQDGIWLPNLKSEICIPTEKQQCYVPSLKDLCQRVMAQHVVEPKNALQVLEISDSLGADDLRKHCEDLVLHNLDYLLTISPMAFAHVRPALLAEVERALDASSAQPWSSRHLPTPTATFPAIVDSEEDDSELGYCIRTRNVSSTDNVNTDTKRASEGFFRQENEVERAVAKQQRALRKKLQQIEALELKQAKGYSLDEQQLAKLQTKQAVKEALNAFDSKFTTDSKAEGSQIEPEPSGVADKSPTAEAGSSRRQRNRGKTNSTPQEEGGQLEDLRRIKAKCVRRSKGSSKILQSIREACKESSGGSMPVKEKKGKAGKQVEVHASNELGNPSSNAVFEGSSLLQDLPALSNQKGINSPSDSFQCPGSHVTENFAKKKNKKGGLSLFLTGALDTVPKTAVHVPILPKMDGPAWGGAQINKGSTSLRDIQSQQIAESSNAPAGDSFFVKTSSNLKKGRQLSEDKHGGLTSLGEVPEMPTNEADAGIQIPLSQFVRRSAPICVTPVKAPKISSGVNSESSPPPWAGTPPLTSASSFRDIQLQQVKQKTHQKHGVSQGSPQFGSPVGLLGFSSKSSNIIMEHSTDLLAAENTSRWFKPETESPSSIRSIQIEEAAMKELRRFYKDVRLVRNEKA